MHHYGTVVLLLFNLPLHWSHNADRPEPLDCHSRTWTGLHILEPETWGCFSLGFGSDHYLHKHQPLNLYTKFPQIFKGLSAWFDLDSQSLEK